MTFDNFDVAEAQITKWEYQFPGVHVEVELNKADAWMTANPNRPKKKIYRFLVNWLSRCHGELLKEELRGNMQRQIFVDERGERYYIDPGGYRVAI